MTQTHRTGLRPAGAGWRLPLLLLLVLSAAVILVTGVAVPPTPDMFYQTDNAPHHTHDELLNAAATGYVDFELLPIMRNRRAAISPAENTSSVTPTLVINAPMGAADAVASSARPLVGVNGAGQRKFVLVPTTTLRPTLVSDPIVSSEEDAIQRQLYDLVDVNENETQSRIDEALKKENFTVIQRDFQFYNSSTYVDAAESNATLQRIQHMALHPLLSKSHRRAVTVELTFDFPFYGHPVRNITVATGGFLYTGDYVHSWLAATQYIAPLMANFDSSLADHSNVRFSDNGTAFTVLWENIHLQDANNNITGHFTFSVTLLASGTIVFNYYTIPIGVDKIEEDNHPVKIGLSDAYIIDKQIVLARRKTIYEYHRVNFDGAEIGNATIIRITPNPTCQRLRDCQSCTGALNSAFKCSWCPALNKCSTGTDRMRQQWLDKDCERHGLREAALCPANGTAGNRYGAEQTYNVPQLTTERSAAAAAASVTQLPIGKSGAGASGSAASVVAEEPHKRVNQRAPHPQPEEEVTSGFFISLLVTVGLVMAMGMWLLYAYRNPHTKSGQLLIQYRPTQWSWRRSEARYTAATIHM